MIFKKLMRFLPFALETCNEEQVNTKPRWAEHVAPNGSKHRANQSCWSQKVLLQVGAPCLGFTLSTAASVQRARAETWASQRAKKEGGGVSGLQLTGTFLRLLPQASANMWQATDVRSAILDLWIWESLCFKTQVSPSKCSPTFWLFFSVIFVRSWWKERDTAQYHCRQSNRKNLVTTLQCQPQQKRQNITKYQ